MFLLKRDDQSMWERRYIELLEREREEAEMTKGLMMC